MLVAGLLSSDQLASIFLNVEQLIQVSAGMFEVNRNRKFDQNPQCVAGELVVLPPFERGVGSGDIDRG